MAGGVKRGSMKAEYRKFYPAFNTVKDAALIAYLDAQTNQTDAIRRALLVQMGEECDEDS